MTSHCWEGCTGELMDYVHEIGTLIQEVSLAIGKPISRNKYEIVD